MSHLEAKNAADWAALVEELRQMRLSAMADELERQCGDPNVDLIQADKRIAALIEAEWGLRYNKKLNRFLKNAHLRYPDATIDESIYDPERMLDADTVIALSACEWVPEGRNVLITGCAGTGKTHIACAICGSVLRKFMTVRYVKALDLIYEIQKADLENRHQENMAEIAKLDILVIDDFGLMDLSADKCRALFEVIDSREGRKSTMVISQLPVKAWYALFSDRTYADSCMDRLVHKAYRLELMGKNMRNPGLNKKEQPKGEVE